MQTNPVIAAAVLAAMLRTAPGTTHAAPVLTDTVPPKEIVIDSKTFLKEEKEAAFPGGDEAWLAFIQKHLKAKTPAKHRAPAGTYTVIARFLIDKEGHLKEIKTLTNHGFGMEEEVLRVLAKSPRWTPAEQNGRKLSSYRRQPITFVVSER